MNYFDKFKQSAMILKKHNPKINTKSGIYFITREFNGFKFAYIGQAMNLLNRLISHYNGYEQHIDCSLKTRKLKSPNNPNGWEISVINVPENELNEKEMFYIKQFADNGYQLYNTTSGSQGNDKFNLTENKERKGYNIGVKNGYEKARKEVARIFDKYLDFSVKKQGKLTEKQYFKFKEWLQGEEK